MKPLRLRQRWSTLQNIFKRALTGDPWSLDTESLPWWQGLIIEIRRVLRLIIKGVRDDNCPLHAAALTYYTLLALIPTMAVGLWILRGVGAGELAKQRILDAIQAMPPEFQRFIEDALQYVDNTDFATLGGIGLLILMWMAITVLARVESSFNKVWAVQVSRGFLRKSADYISILVVVPILIITATTINTAMSSEVLALFFEDRFGISSSLYRRSLSFTPWIGAWMALAFMNIYIPNTRVRIMPGLISGLIGGSLWIVWQLLYLRFQFGIAKYNAIYGTFASVPVFLAWVYISWQIVLISAEIAFAIQNRNTYRHEHEEGAADLRSRFMVMLAILARAADAMMNRHAPLDSATFAESQAIPARLVNETLTMLTRNGYLIEAAEPRGAVVLLRNPETIRLRDIAVDALETGPRHRNEATEGLAAPYHDAWLQLEAGLTGSLGETTLSDFVRGDPGMPDNAPDPASPPSQT